MVVYIIKVRILLCRFLLLNTMFSAMHVCITLCDLSSVGRANLRGNCKSGAFLAEHHVHSFSCDHYYGVLSDLQ